MSVNSSGGAAPEFNEEDFLFEKKHVCPVCSKEFKELTVKTGKARVISQDIDLRPRYETIDAIKYDVVACPNCGYAALDKNFAILGSPRAKLIRENICPAFSGLGPAKLIYNYHDAYARHKLALVNTIVKHGKPSERAYLCMKLTWLVRAKKEHLNPNSPNYQKEFDALTKEELDYARKTYDCFVEAVASEYFPMVNLDEHTVTYIMAAFAETIGEYEEAEKLLSRLITSRTANERIKDKARTLRDMVKEKVEKES